jgi:hypothetical protein
MAFGSLDRSYAPADNRCMERTTRSRLHLLCALSVVMVVSVVLTGCAGVSAGASPNNSGDGGGTNPPPASPGTLQVSPSTLNFGNVGVGASSSLKGTLTASGADVTIASADWSGTGYAVSGITFPVTVSVGQNTKYTVTFTPPTAGALTGNITFTSDASNDTLNQTFKGTGTQSQPPSQHSVSLNWDPSTSVVVGYNIYRGTQSGGPYSKLNSSLLAATSYDDSSVQSGSTYYYVSTAVDTSSQESAFSNEASADVP